jgi:hypothetical protein
MIAFQPGAFRLNVGIQPIIVSYPFSHHDVSWTPDYSIGRLLWRTVTQVYNRMHVLYLPLVEPIQAPLLFADAVQGSMLRASGRALSHVTVHDKLLYSSLKRACPPAHLYALTAFFPVLETKEALRQSHRQLQQLTALAQRFFTSDVDRRGNLCLAAFRTFMGTEWCSRLFQWLDTDRDGAVSWIHVVMGSVAGVLLGPELMVPILYEHMGRGTDNLPVGNTNFPWTLALFHQTFGSNRGFLQSAWRSLWSAVPGGVHGEEGK